MVKCLNIGKPIYRSISKIHGSVRYIGVTVRYIFDTGGGRGNWLHSNVGNIPVLNHEGKPMDITEARVWTRANFVQYSCR